MSEWRTAPWSIKSRDRGHLPRVVAGGQNIAIAESLPKAEQIIADHAAAQREATERERADKAEAELSHDYEVFKKVLASEEAASEEARADCDAAEAELANERAAAEALAEALELSLRVLAHHDVTMSAFDCGGCDESNSGDCEDHGFAQGTAAALVKLREQEAAK